MTLTKRTVPFGSTPAALSTLSIAGFDPLAEPAQDDPSIQRLLEDSRRRDVLNILRSYTGTFDCFAEAVQNSLDAVEKRHRISGGSYEPKIWITIDIENSLLRFTDNGVGMSLPELLYFLRPNVSFKSRREFRGHKGVGATFLAYDTPISECRLSRARTLGRRYFARAGSGRKIQVAA